MKDTDHWLASPRREEFFGPLGVTNIRTFVDPQNPTRVGLVMDVADMDVVMAAMETPRGGCRRWSTTACCPRRWSSSSRPNGAAISSSAPAGFEYARQRAGDRVDLCGR